MPRDESVMEHHEVALDGTERDEQDDDDVERVVDETPDTTEEIGRKPDQIGSKADQNQW